MQHRTLARAESHVLVKEARQNTAPAPQLMQTTRRAFPTPCACRVRQLTLLLPFAIVLRPQSLFGVTWRRIHRVLVRVQVRPAVGGTAC